MDEKDLKLLLNKIALKSFFKIRSTRDDVTLIDRIPKKYEQDVSKARNPASGPLVSELESIFESHGLKITSIDGYIVSKDELVVTRLFICREYGQKVQDFSMDTMLVNVDFIARQLLPTIDLEALKQLSMILQSPVDLVFTPMDYPIDSADAENQKITLVRDLFANISVEILNIDSFREYLESHKKRPTKKGMTFACTKLEYHLANVKRAGKEYDYAFPGDLDGIIFDKNYKPICILEYKSDTENHNIKNESTLKYSIDTTRYKVLSDMSKILEVPLVIIFWSDRHQNAKIIINPKYTENDNGEIINANSYDELATKIFERMSTTLFPPTPKSAQ